MIMQAEYMAHLVSSSWPQLSDIKQFSAKAFRKDPDKAKIMGLSYDISLQSIYPVKYPCLYFNFQGWTYNIYNEYQEYDILSFLLTDRPSPMTPQENAFFNLRVLSHSYPVTQLAVFRSLNAALTMIRQIDNNIVTAPQKILRMHKVLSVAPMSLSRKGGNKKETRIDRHPSYKSFFHFDNDKSNIN